MSDIMQELYELGQAEGKAEGYELGQTEGKEEGKAEGKAEGIVEEKLTNIKNLMESVTWTAQQAMDALKIPAEEQPQYLTML